MKDERKLLESAIAMLESMAKAMDRQLDLLHLVNSALTQMVEDKKSESNDKS